VKTALAQMSVTYPVQCNGQGNSATYLFTDNVASTSSLGYPTN